MNEILTFMSGLLPLIEEEYNLKDPDKIGPKTSKYISEKLQPERSKREDLKTYEDYDLKCGCHAEPGMFSRYVNCNLDHINEMP